MATIRLGKRTENRAPLIKDLVPLASLDDLVFGAWGPVSSSTYTAACKAGVLERAHIERVGEFLKGITPLPAAFDNKYVTRINGPNVKRGKTKRDLAEQIRQDIRDSTSRSIGSSWARARTAASRTCAPRPASSTAGGSPPACGDGRSRVRPG